MFTRRNWNLILSCLVVNLGSFGFSKNESVFTSEEQKALDAFRPLAHPILTHDYQKTDAYLIRWLRAEKLDIGMAFKRLELSQKWRKENDIEGILNKNLFPLGFNCPANHDGVDKKGRPILIIKYGKIDVRKVLLTGKKESFFRRGYQVFEEMEIRMQDVANQTGRPVTEFIQILDFNGFSLRSHLCKDCPLPLLHYFRLTETFYPHASKDIIWLNSPRFAIPFKEFIEDGLKEYRGIKLKVFGTEKGEWSDFLKSIVAPDQLPVEYGGTRTDMKFTD